jgi:hypothetical protein
LYFSVAQAVRLMTGCGFVTLPYAGQDDLREQALAERTTIVSRKAKVFFIGWMCLS